LTHQLNPEQHAAVTHVGGPLLILAGAGSGKTRVITQRIVHLIHERHLAPERILAVTFTNKAAREMRERLVVALGGEVRGLYVGTFHAWGLGFLRRHARLLGLSPEFTVLDRADQLTQMAEVLKNLRLDETRFPKQRLVARISRIKNGLEDAEDSANPIWRRVGKAYEERLKARNALDFDDLLARPVEALKQHPELTQRLGYEHVLVDEYQDTNHAQAALLRLLAPASGGITVVGDEDQSIYAFRGAKVDHILHFEKTFPGTTVMRLERNYRSTAAILGAASAVVAANRNRLGKALRAEGAPGEPVEIHGAPSGEAEADLVGRLIAAELKTREACEVAVLYRTNAQARPIEEVLVRRGVPYIVVKGLRFYDRREIKDLLAYLRLLLNPDDDLALERVINVPARGIGMATLEALRERAQTLATSLWGALEEGGTEGAGAGRLAAFHGLLARLRGEAARLPPSALLRLTFKETGYGPHLGGDEEEGDNAKARLDNVEALVDKAASFDALGPEGLRALVDEASLASDADRLGEAKAVSLMTLHNAKGLEFDTVFVTGVEEGLLPHRGLESDDEDTAPDVEEERRLLYVGMTRARHRLVLSYARRRRFLGREMDQGPSRFLDDIPEALCRRSEERKDDEQGVRSFFGVAAPAAVAATPAPPRERGEVSFRAGSRVRHPDYGPGNVLSSEGSGDSLKVVVRFDRVGRKKLAAKFAGLTAIK